MQKTIIKKGDIIVTTPLSERENAKKEGKYARQAGHDTYYFRRFSKRPKLVKKGSRVFYVEAGYIRGFAVVSIIDNDPDGYKCDATDRIYDGGIYLHMYADSWKWIKPVPMKGFQGFRYLEPGREFEIVGGWLDPMPETR